MQIKDLPPATLAALKKRRYDRFIEKHEGPFRWESELNRYDPKTLEHIEFYKKNVTAYHPVFLI